MAGIHIYYCEITRSRQDLAAGVYSVATDSTNHRWYPRLNRLVTASERVWKQGPKGGVKIIKDRDWEAPISYITNDNEWMKKFAWVKLKAQML